VLTIGDEIVDVGGRVYVKATAILHERQVNQRLYGVGLRPRTAR